MPIPRRSAARDSCGQHKRIEEIFGGLKTVGGLRQSRFVGIKRAQLHACPAATEDAKRPSPDDLKLMRDIDEDLMAAASASPCQGPPVRLQTTSEPRGASRRGAGLEPWASGRTNLADSQDSGTIGASGLPLT
jgi:hypothetical protein